MNIKKEELANKIIEFLKKYKMHKEVFIFFDNKQISCKTGKVIDENINMEEYFKRPDVVIGIHVMDSGKFEDVLNYANESNGYLEIQNEFRTLVKEYGCWYDHVNAVCFTILEKNW